MNIRYYLKKCSLLLLITVFVFSSFAATAPESEISEPEVTNSDESQDETSSDAEIPAEASETELSSEVNNQEENEARSFEANYPIKTGTHEKYMSGYKGSLFKPDASITRGEFAVVIYTLLANKPAAPSGKFSDVADGIWYTTAINALANAGIISGYKDGTFKPEQTIKRSEATSIFAYFTSPAYYELDFTDVSEGYWAYSYIQTAVTRGWIGGYKDGTFKPENPISRAEVTKITNLVTGRTSSSDYAKDRNNADMQFKDVDSGYWGYLDIIEAAKPIPGDPDPDPDPEVPTSKYIVTTDAVNFRTEPSTASDASIITVLYTNTVLTVIDATSYTPWIKAKYEKTGQQGYVHSDYVKDYDSNGGSEVNEGEGAISASSATIPQYKSLYINTTLSGSGLNWVSDNSGIASVAYRNEDKSMAFVYAKSPGSTKIHLKDHTGAVKASCTITVSSAEPVRYVYSDPVTPNAGASFNLKAITDSSKTAVKFVVKGAASGTYETTEFTTESNTSEFGLPVNNVRIFSKGVTFNTAGKYTVYAYSKTASGSWSSSYAKYDFLVSTASSPDATTTEERSPSSSIVKIIAAFEGSEPEVYIDTLPATNMPTVGCGYVIPKNTAFYDNLTSSEINAQLLNTINNGSYTSAVNNFRKNNSIKMNQYQFDSLLSFAYNLGPNNFKTSYETFRVLLNASAPPKLPAGGTVNNEEVEVYASHSATSSRIGTISISTPVTVTEVKRIDGNVDQLWYKVSYSGTSGWIRGGHVRFSSYSGCDLAYVDEQLFGSNLLEWNKSGGVMLPGLVYRRLGEAKIFCYGNYTDAHSGSANYRVNVGFDLPF